MYKNKVLKKYKTQIDNFIKSNIQDHCLDMIIFDKYIEDIYSNKTVRFKIKYGLQQEDIFKNPKSIYKKYNWFNIPLA